MTDPDPTLSRSPRGIEHGGQSTTESVDGELVDPQTALRELGMLVEQTYRRGPLPTAEELEAYERALPGGAGRIVAMAEREQDPRHRCDQEDRRIETRGQHYALVAVAIFAALAALA